MLNSSSIISHVDDIKTTPNELRNNIYTTNRNLLKLLDNDRELADAYIKIFESRGIKPYDPDLRPYAEGTYVWYYDDDSSMLYILRCILPGNTNLPVNDHGRFNESGWQNEFEQLNILDYGLSSMLEARVVNKYNEHETDPAYHVHGKLSLDKDSDDYIGNKLLRKDLSNINPLRKHVHFPIKTYYMTADNTIIRGFYRRYDTGYIEYDILFKLGYTTEKNISKFGIRDIYVCNNVVLNQFTSVSASILRKLRDENSKYFVQTSDSDIFRIQNELSDDCYSIVGSTVYKNRSDYVNTYAGTIKFPVPFNNLNYTIFCSDTMSQTADLSTMNVGSNTMIFADRAYDSIKAIYVTYPLGSDEDFNETGYNTSRGGLAVNGFHVRVCGTCAKEVI